MPRLSFFLGALIGLGALSTSVYTQELILEETETGYLIVNWEDTVVVDTIPVETEEIEEVQVEEVSGNTSSDFLPHKGKKSSHKKGKNLKKNSKKHH